MSLVIRLTLGLFFAVYITAPLSALGFLPMAVGVVLGAAAFIPAYLQARKY